MNSNDILDNSRINKWAVGLIRISYWILLIQNIPFVNIIMYFNIIPFFPIDLIAFLLLAGGYLLYSTQEVEHKRSYFLGVLGLLGWSICRVLYQYIIPFGLRLWLWEEFPYFPWSGAFLQFFGGVKYPDSLFWTF
ncbi:MAG: hypothetical protein ACFFC7_07960 [Candidatus Hermodarchaeota archaeon]